MKIEKFDENQRTFETRLLFIAEIFENKYDKNEIMTSCIQHKLDSSLAIYEERVYRSNLTLQKANPLNILQKIDQQGG